VDEHDLLTIIACLDYLIATGTDNNDQARLERLKAEYSDRLSVWHKNGSKPKLPAVL
jgi:hypothetical protein